MGEELFRKAALERLSSPERLDTLLKVTSPRGWLALIAVGIVLIAAAVWAFYGSIPSKVSGRGILIKTGGVLEIVSPRPGTIKALYFSPGDVVQRGRVVARLDQPEIEGQVKDAREELEILRAKQRDANQRILSGYGGSTDVNEIHERIQVVERSIRELTEQLSETSRIQSTYTGRVIEVGVREGEVVEKGAPLIKIELMGRDVKNLEALLYFPAGEGKKIHLGMRVQVSPSTARPEEFGYALGMVTYVSEYPSTRQAMIRALQNTELADRLSQGGAPIEVRADLIPDPRTPSGYKWSSGAGPPVSLQTGTLCSAKAIIAEEPPINLALPAFKRNKAAYGSNQQ